MYTWSDIINRLLEERPQLAYQSSDDRRTPLLVAVIGNKIEIVKLLLNRDPNLAYVSGGKDNESPFLVASIKGFVPLAKEILKACPDAAYMTNNFLKNALHSAIDEERQDFVDFILRTPQLHRLINQIDVNGLPLHYAAKLCNPEILRSVLSHKDQDYTACNVSNCNAVDIVCGEEGLMKTLKWNESFTLLSGVIGTGWENDVEYLAKKEIKRQAIEEVKALTERYTSNTSLVAALLATITFAAAFTLPGGFSSDPSDAGLPIFARKAAFQVFLISDTIAMCSSLAVAFLCILATWEDLDYLLNYRKTTKVLMWCAYAATAVAFGTALFTVMATKSLWLAIFILILCSILPFLSKIIGDWPQIMVRLRLGGRFRSDLVPHI